MIEISPLTRRQWRRFRSLKRGYYSAVLLAVLLLLSCMAELLVNNRAIAVSYHGKLFLPTYGAYLPGTTFGFDYDYETDYRALEQRTAAVAGVQAFPRHRHHRA